MGGKKETQHAVVEQVKGTGKIIKVWWFDARKNARDFHTAMKDIHRSRALNNTKLVIVPMERGPHA